MIALSNLEKSYAARAGEIVVLRRIELAIAEGEFVMIMGPSGARLLLADEPTGNLHSDQGREIMRIEVRS